MKRSLVSLLIMSMLLSTSTFALTPEEIKTRDTKQQQMIQKSKSQVNKALVEARKANPYEYQAIFMDKYKNYLTVNTTYNASGYAVGSRYYKPFVINDTATLDGYKPVKLQTNVNKAGVITKYITMEPAKTINVVMGTVKLNSNSSYKNVYIEVFLAKDKNRVDTGASVEPRYILKVADNGTFKMVNMPNGDYLFRVATGEMKTIYEARFGNSSTVRFVKNLIYPYEQVSVKGNLNKTFNYVGVKQEVCTIDNLLKDYTTTNLFDTSFENTPALQMSDKLKKAVDSQLKNNNDVDTLKKIHRFLQTYFTIRESEDGYSTRLLKTVNEIETLGGGWLDNCGEYATMFSAIANYLDIPNNIVSSISIAWVESQNTQLVAGHTFVEAFVNNKWVIVDSTTGAIGQNYDRDDSTIIEDTAGIGTMYVIAKTKIPTEYMWDWSSQLDATRELFKVFDLSAVNKNTVNVLK